MYSPGYDESLAAVVYYGSSTEVRLSPTTVRSINSASLRDDDGAISGSIDIQLGIQKCQVGVS